MIRVPLPQLGESIVEGTVTRWRVAPGDRVARDQAIVEVETDKASVEVPAPAAGVVTRLLVPEGETVSVGTVLCEIDGAEAEVSPAPAAPPVTPRVAPVAPPRADTDAERYSPVVRRLATERGVDLAKVTGTGGGGRVTRQDVLAAAPAAGRDEQVVPWSRRRRLIAEHMMASRDAAAHVACVAEADMTPAVRLRQTHRSLGLTYTAFVLDAAVRALKDEPRMNATVRGETTVLHKRIHLGVAVEAEEGLIVPVIRDAGRLTLAGLARALEDLAGRARAGKILPDELRGGTFTVSNPGPRGNLFGTALLHQPEVGILRMGEIVKRPVVVEEEGDDRIAIRSMMYLCLSYDHRVVDGVLGNAFLRRVKEILEAGQFAV
jgi:2-oxoglutarate dehydrogenase E2 component (dihydrolipoamide succinyltransferase)